MHISLTPELKDFVKQKVDSGLYGNASEVIRDALRQMNRYEEFFYFISIIMNPLKDDPPLIVNSNTVIILKITDQFFQPVRWWNS